MSFFSTRSKIGGTRLVLRVTVNLTDRNSTQTLYYEQCLLFQSVERKARNTQMTAHAAVGAGSLAREYFLH